MGSCYSCRSKGGTAPFYTTTSASSDMAAVENVIDKRKPPYARTSSFGFKRRVPAVIKSHSQERTGELVNIYESKIASTTTTTVPRPGHSCTSTLSGKQMPSSSVHSTTTTTSRFGFKKPVSNINCHDNLHFSTNVSDDNSNLILAGNGTSFSSSTTSVKSTVGVKTSSARNSPKRSGVTTSRDNSPDQRSVTKNLPDNVKNDNETSRINKLQQNNSAHNKCYVAKLPKQAMKVKTQVSGLPKPQIPIIVAKSFPNDGMKNSVELKYDHHHHHLSKDVEPMQISSENIPEDELQLAFEVDSGLGNSVSDKKAEEDTETLNEVEQIEGDATSLSSSSNKERTPERRCPNLVENQKLVKKEENTMKKNLQELQTKLVKPSGIVRPKMVYGSAKAFPTKVDESTATKMNKVNGYRNATSYLQQPKLLSGKRNADDTSKAKMQASKCKLLSKEMLKKEQSLSGKEFGSNDEWKIVTEITENATEPVTSDVEEVEIVPIALCGKAVAATVTSLDLKPGNKCNQKKIESVLPTMYTASDGGGHSTKMKISDLMQQSSSFSNSGDDSAENSIKEAGGMYSPPFEKDLFLDDEIADQPALIACQTYNMSSIAEAINDQSLLGRTAATGNPSVNAAEMDEEGGIPDLAQPALSVKIPRLRSCSVDIGSPCSSLGSDDLMLDFDQTLEGIYDVIGERESAEVFVENGGDENYILPSGKLSSPYVKSTSVGVILEEWGSLIGSHGIEGSSPDTKFRLKSASCAVSAAGGGGGGPGAARNCDSGTGPSSPSVSSSSSPSAVSHGYMRRSVVQSFRPPRQISVSEAEDGSATIDPMSFLSISQDTTNMKTLLLRLKRVLQEAETLNPFESSPKNGLFRNLANSDPPEGVTPNGVSDCGDEATSVQKIEQENADLRRQAVFMQQQIEDRDRTIKLLQQQMVKYLHPQQNEDGKEFSNAACQTERPKLLLSNSFSSSGEDSLFGSTVSCQPSQQQQS